MAHTLAPASIACTHCKTPCGTVTDLKPPKSAKLDGAYSALCPNCGLVNYAIYGEPEHTQRAYRGLAAEFLKRYEGKPKSMVCERCKAPATHLECLPTEGMVGIDSVWGSTCRSCGHVTYDIQGNPIAVASIRRTLAMASKT